MIQVSCSSCSKSFRVKDAAAGKRFECSGCGEVITVPSAKPKPKASGGTKSGSSGTTSTKRRAGGAAAAAGAKKKSKPQYDDDLDFEDDDLEFEDGAGGYDEYGEDDYDDGGYDDYDDYGDDDYDDYEPAPKKRPSKSSRSGGSKSKSKSSKSKAKSKPAKKKKSSGGGGLAIGFNINRLNAALCVLGVMSIVFGVRETILAGKANAEPTQMSLQELISNGVGDNIHLTLTGMNSIIEETVVYGDEKPGGQISNYDKVWIPVTAEGGDGSVKLIVKSTNAKTDGAVQNLASKTTHTGLIVNDIESISGEERQLLSTVPGVNMDAVYIVHERRTPTGAGMLILYYVGGLLLLAGGLFWIFLVH